MWLLCSLTLSAFCFLFPLSIQLQRPPHTFLSCSALSVWYFLCAIDVRCVHLAILLWRRAEWMISAHHESFGQWSEQRNEFLFEKFLIRWLFFGVRLLIFFNGIIINLLVAEKKRKRNWGDEIIHDARRTNMNILLWCKRYITRFCEKGNKTMFCQKRNYLATVREFEARRHQECYLSRKNAQVLKW